VGRDAVVRRSIVWEGSSIGAGANLNDAIVGMRYTVDDGARLDGAVVAGEEVPADATR
jgi:NDP-sugar pyrophosphorylase family protein